MMPEEGERLRSENQALREANERLTAQVAVLLTELAKMRAELAAALERMAELEQQQSGPPSFVKPNRPKAGEEKLARRKRKAEANHGRKRAKPTRVVRHALERCPSCGYRLSGESLDRTREVIELPEPQPVEVIEHQVIKRWCPHCERYQSPKVDLQGQVLARGRIGVRIASLVGYLRTSLRLPIRSIQGYLSSLHQLDISVGEVVELLHDLRQATIGAVADLQQQMQAGDIVQADETGWREDGHNGYIWAFSTPGPAGVRYYEYAGSRAGAVAERILGPKFSGHLVTDFYDAYNIYPGRHQRCWVHLLRDLHKLNAEHPHPPEVHTWAAAVRALYDEAQQFLKAPDPPTQAQRQQKYESLVARIDKRGLQYAPATFQDHPCWALCKRLLRHQAALFQFVLVDGLPADNNLAERAIRPLVVIRKVSGGSRSAHGSQTRMALASLFGTWLARGLNPFYECLRLLGQTPVPQV
jgi:hypothetical protein